MHYKMDSKTGYFHVTDTPRSRIEAAEKEIAAVLGKYGCILIVQVAAKDKE